MKAKLNTLKKLDLESYLESARLEGTIDGEKYNHKSMLDAEQRIRENMYAGFHDEEKLKTQLDHLNSSLDRRTRYHEDNLKLQEQIDKKDRIIKKRNEEIDNLNQQNVTSQLKIDELQMNAMETLQRESRAQDKNRKNYAIYKGDTADVTPSELLYPFADYLFNNQDEISIDDLN